MKIVCSSSVQYGMEAFSTLGKTVGVNGRSICSQDVRDAEILVIRSTTRVNKNLLEHSQVKFVCTATIGMDHIDTAYLDERGIKWCCAPGCNANSVAEYVSAAVLTVACRKNFSLSGKTIGVIGVGNVGSLVCRKAEALGMRILRNDPPKARQTRQIRAETVENTGNSFVDLNRVLAESDIITLHVPLTMDGPDATFALADKSFFDRMKPGSIFINTARGAVMNTEALLAAMKKGIVSDAVIDTWEGEPDFSMVLLNQAAIATPHIAGYSFEGRVMGTVMIYKQTCEVFGFKSVWTPDNLLPTPAVPEIEIKTDGRPDEVVLNDIIRRVYDVESDDARFRAFDGNKCISGHFERLRSDYPIRREFRFTRVNVEDASPPLKNKIAGLGFGIKS